MQLIGTFRLENEYEDDDEVSCLSNVRMRDKVTLVAKVCFQCFGDDEVLSKVRPEENEVSLVSF